MTACQFPVEKISEFLKISPRSNEELRQLTGLSRSGVNNQMERMVLAKLAHRKRHEIRRAAGFCWMWHDGPAKDENGLELEADSPRIPGYVPRQKTVRQYPVIGRRDALVAAFFGQAKATS